MNDSESDLLSTIYELLYADTLLITEPRTERATANPMQKGALNRTINRPTSVAFVEIPFELILPFGSGAAYSLDSSGRVSGIKLGTIRDNGPKILNLVAQFPNIRRAVIFAQTPLEIQDSFADLDLELAWFGGTIHRLPEKLFQKGLPIFTAKESSKNLLRQVLSRAALSVVQPRINDKPVFHSVAEAEIAKNPEYGGIAAELSSIRGLFISSSEVADPPFEIIARGPKAVISYFAERGTSYSLPLNELKVILVGNGGAGKTSLAKKLVNQKFDAKEKQTHGIKITKWSITTDDETTITLNSWDFGGQEIMHATHQFFLSKRSVYLLVLDGRKDEDPEYWLQHIESFGADSPIFVVLNKIDEHPAFELNRRFLLAKYKGIVDFFRVSCSKNVGIAELLDRLRVELPKMPMLQTRWPDSWFQVKKKIESHSAPFIALSDYRTVCKDFAILDAENQELLVDFLHDLGIILHFKDMQLLDTHVLDPKWVTEGVYRIINSPIVAENKGILPLGRLSQILKRPPRQVFEYPAEKHAFLVDLMLKFEVCYRLNVDDILIPDS